MKSKILMSLFLASGFTITGNAFNTLSELTKACFKEYPEYAERNKNHSKRLALPKDNLYDKIANNYQTDTDSFNNDKKWMNQKKVPNDFFQVNSPNNFATNGFVEKVTVAPGSTICLMGDYHGSQHSLLRNLWRLVKLGHLNDNFEIVDKAKFYMVFLGDYINFGSLSDEVVYTVLKLKEKNWNNVFLTNGNNEFSDSRTIFKYNSMAVFIGWPGHYVQCCHSSVSLTEDFSDLLTSDNLQYALIKNPAKCCSPFLRQDQLSGTEIDTTTITKHLEKQGLKALFRGHQDSFFGLKMFAPPNFVEEQSIDDHIANLEQLKKTYKGKEVELKITTLNSIKKEQKSKQKVKNKTKSFQTKFLADPTANGNFTKPQQLITIMDYGTATRDTESTFSNERGPYNWKSIVDIDDLTNPAGIQISKKNYVPIYTLTTATEGRNVPYDSFCLLKTAVDFKNWRLKPFETNLDQANKFGFGNRHNKFNALFNTSDQLDQNSKNFVIDNLITIKWSDTKNDSGLDQSLVKIAKSNTQKKSNVVSPLPQSLTTLKTKLVSLVNDLGKMESGKQAKTASNQWKISQEGNKFYREQEGKKEELTVAKLNEIYKNTNFEFRLESATGPQGGWFIYRYDKTKPKVGTETVALSGGGTIIRPIYKSGSSSKATKEMLQEMASSLPKYTYFIKAEGEDGKRNTVYRNNAKTGVEESMTAQKLNTVWKKFIIKDKGIPSNQRKEYFKKHENLPDFKFAKSQWHKQPGPNDKLEPGAMTGPFPYENTIKHKKTSVKRKEKPHPSGRPSRTDIEISFHPLGLEELNYEEKGTIVTPAFLNGRPELQADL